MNSKQLSADENIISFSKEHILKG